MKKQIALALAGTAATIAGGLRLIKDLVDQGDHHQPGTGIHPDEQERATPPPAPSSTAPPPASASPGTPPEGAGTAKTASEPTGPRPVLANADASKAELYEMATKLDISGRSKMSKADLIEAINRAG